jgi:hypothetical protein
MWGLLSEFRAQDGESVTYKHGVSDRVATLPLAKNVAGGNSLLHEAVCHAAAFVHSVAFDVSIMRRVRALPTGTQHWQLKLVFAHTQVQRGSTVAPLLAPTRHLPSQLVGGPASKQRDGLNSSDRAEISRLLR